MFGLHSPELIIVLLIGSLLFGARRLPEMGSAVGKTIKEFQRSMREVTEPAHAPSDAVPVPSLPQPRLAAPVAPASDPAETATATPREMAIPGPAHQEPIQAA
jgi:sec-independent protein translocase protein TatA